MKEVRRFKWPALLLFLLISMLALAACGYTNGTNDDNNNDNVEGRVAGANQQVVYGYIVEVNDQARTVLVDEFNLVTANDTDQIGTLNLDRDRDFINGYYINDNARAKRLYPLATTADLKISDYDYSGSSFYNQRWGLNNGGVGNAEGLTSDLTNNTNNNLTDNLTDNMTNNNGITRDEFNDELNNPNTNAGEIMNNDAHNETAKGDMASTSKMPAYYVGANYQVLRDRMTAYEHVPFMLTLENGKVVKIEEIDYLYHNNTNNNTITNNNNNNNNNNNITTNNNTNINR